MSLQGYSINTPNLVPPKVIQRFPVAYTSAARQAKVTGEVQLMIRVGADGRPELARVTKSLDKTHGLDEQAMFAVGRFVFEPARLDGKAVPVDDMPIAFSFAIY
jgi:TonB family protein